MQRSPETAPPRPTLSPPDRFPHPRALRGVHSLAIAPTPFFGDYGCHVRIVEEISALQDHGVETTIVTYPFGRTLGGVPIRRALHLPGQRRVNPGSSPHKLTMDAALGVKALQSAVETRPHLVHGHLHEGALIGWSVARAGRVPVVLDFQGSMTSEMIDHGFLRERSVSHRFFRSIERWIVDHVDAIVTSTRHGADVLMREFGCAASRITVVPDAVNTQRFRPMWELIRENGHLKDVEELRAQLGIPGDRPVVVYLGLLAEYQGITHLLRAAQALIERGVRAHFLVMGFPGEERYRRVADRLGLGPHVTFTGAVAYEETPHYLALGQVAVSPKLSETEGNGKLLNYIAMGLPTVAFDTAVSREILGDLGVYAPCGDWSALANEMEVLLQDAAAATDRGRALRAQAVAAHSWERSVEALLGVYERLLF